jgi:molybdate transport system substrate-binding protein
LTRRRANRLSLSLLLVVGLLVTTVRAAGVDIVVMTSGTFTAAYFSLAKIFAGSSGDRFVTAATKMGVGPQSIPSRLDAGEAVDLVIVASDALDRLIAEGRVVRGSRVDLARSRIAMAVRQGARTPDITSVAALKRTLLAATSVAISSSVSGDYFVKDLFPRLGIADQMRAKTQQIVRGSVGVVVARGDAEIGFQQISELRRVPGITIVGPLPGETQRVTLFSAGIPLTAKHPDAARAFLRYLASPAAQHVIAETGLEPLHAR